MRKIQNLPKQFKSFFRQIFTTWKGLVILGYVIACAVLYFRFADKQLISDIVHDFTLKNILSLFSFNLIWHVVLMLAALALLFLLTASLGTCRYRQLEIKKYLPIAMLPEKKGIAQPENILYIPYPKQGYAEFEFDSRGIPKERWDERRKAVESALNITIIGDIGHGGDDWSIIAFKARKGASKPGRGTLYDE